MRRVRISILRNYHWANCAKALIDLLVDILFSLLQMGSVLFELLERAGNVTAKIIVALLFAGLCRGHLQLFPSDFFVNEAPSACRLQQLSNCIIVIYLSLLISQFACKEVASEECALLTARRYRHLTAGVTRRVGAQGRKAPDTGPRMLVVLRVLLIVLIGWPHILHQHLVVLGVFCRLLRAAMREKLLS